MQQQYHPGWAKLAATSRVTLWHAELMLLQDSHVVHTGQFFMPEPVLSAVEVMEPYVQHNGTARVRNAHVSS